MEKNYKKLVLELSGIGIQLSAEQDVDKLLEIILEESMKISCSDGGSIYIKEADNNNRWLRFKVSRNFSRNIDFTEFTLPLDNKSIAGYVGMSGKALKISDINNIPSEVGIKYNPAFDKKISYKTINMLVIPLKDYTGDVVGVIQLINKKKSYNIVLGNEDNIIKDIVDYDEEEIEIISSLAAQAGILVERTKLYNEIQELLRSFIESMVVTLDSRDITTSGHSRRLAGYAKRFLETVDRVEYGIYKNCKFGKDEVREIYYAALLHDIGKIGVKESILQKSGRVSKEAIEAIKYRIKYAYLLLNKEQKLMLNIDSKELIKKIEDINNKGFINDEEINLVNLCNKIVFCDDGVENKLLTDFEVENLSVRKGNLTENEREEMNSHVKYSYEILKGINWTKGLRNVPEIAGAHHEKIDGTGYPNHISGEKISIQARILAIADIFEALTARDRPYKPPMSVEKALSILEFEVKDNHLDKELYEIFIKEKIYEMYQEELNKIIKI